jgi:integrase
MPKTTLTAARVIGFKCPPDKQQVFLWDATEHGLGLRATPNGKPAYVFQGVYQGKTIRMTIGEPTAWSVAQAREKAREFQRQLDEGKDPRQLKTQALAQAQATKKRQQQEAQAQALTVGMAWADYIQDRTPSWGDRHRQDHERLSKEGGKTTNRGTQGRGVTQEGILRPLLALPLSKLSPAVIEDWAKREGQTRPTVARLAWRLLRGFLNWCAEHPDYAAMLNGANPAKTKRTREALGKAQVKADALLKEQLPAWFAAVQAIPNPVISAYLQVLLLTGARPNEVRSIRWEDVGLSWRSLTIRDKVEGERMIPLTPYIHHLIASLPRRNEWVFSSDRNAASITDPNHAHSRACTVAGIDGLTLHGLRRSFKSLTEWLDIPAGVVAQLQGHKPSATAEKHYTVRPLDLLRIHHERIEAWILEQAGISFTPSAVVGRLRVVA